MSYFFATSKTLPLPDAVDNLSLAAVLTAIYNCDATLPRNVIQKALSTLRIVKSF